MATVRKFAAEAAPLSEKRRNRRWRGAFQGTLFFPDRGVQSECEVLDVSSGGASLKTTASAPEGTPIVLYIEDVGRIEGIVAARDRLRLGMRFTCSDAMRARLEERLAGYAKAGRVESAALRQRFRIPDLSALERFSLTSGEIRQCELLDLVLSEVSLKTQIRPPIGDHIFFGNVVAKVVRHSDCGIGVKFMGTVKAGMPPLTVRRLLGDA